jgi:small subunit ribosomal protein S20
MPIIKSAKKRVKTANKAAIRNAKVKRNFRTAVKEFRIAVAGGEKKLGDSHAKAQSEIDKAVKKGILHKNKAARQKAQLAKAAKEAGATTTGVTKKTAKAPAATAAKKAPVRAKAPAKKPAAKKPVAKTKTAKK